MNAPLCHCAQTLYVDASNTNPNPDGTTLNPYPTITQALNAISSGDTIQVNPGTYTDPLTIKKNITLTGTDRETCIIEVAAPNYGILIDSFPSQTSYPIIKNLRIIQDAAYIDHPDEDEQVGIVEIGMPGGTGYPLRLLARGR
jgi:hypothetical protein